MDHGPACAKARRREWECFIWKTAKYLLWLILKDWKDTYQTINSGYLPDSGIGGIIGKHLLSRYLKIIYTDQKLSEKKFFFNLENRIHAYYK